MLVRSKLAPRRHEIDQCNFDTYQKLVGMWDLCIFRVEKLTKEWNTWTKEAMKICEGGGECNFDTLQKFVRNLRLVFLCSMEKLTMECKYENDMWPVRLHGWWYAFVICNEVTYAAIQNLLACSASKIMHIRVIHKVTLSLCLLSPHIPSFSGVCKLMKIY
jgi:hypothetical protein